jgi:two-component system heavy metal sensor histidine kinase CusS
MSFRTRMVVAVTVITLVTLGVAFAVISVVVTRSQEHHLDAALQRAAYEEAKTIAGLDATALAIRRHPALVVNDAGPLAPYSAIYDRAGTVKVATSGFAAAPPELGALRPPSDRCFDFRLANEHMRGVLTDVPGTAGLKLLFAVSRADLDGDATFLQRAMELVFAVAVAWTVGVATWIVRRLTRNQRRIAEVVRRVAAGDLSARVGVARAAAPAASQAAAGDEVRLGADVDNMIDRLAGLLNAQRVFIAHAAHELRSPLTALYGELALALRRSRDAGEYRAAIGEALDSTRQLKGLAEDLLAVARLGTAPPPPAEAIDVRQTVEEAKRIVLQADGPTGIHIEVSGRARPVRAGGRDLVRLFRNLIENAVRHSPPGGAIFMSIADDDAGRVSVAIVDQGPGIPEAERGRIFEAFYQGTSVPTASGAEVGLGLTIARGIARAYGGDVALAPEQSGGACFRVTLPAAPEAAAAAGNDSTAAAS